MEDNKELDSSKETMQMEDSFEKDDNSVPASDSDLILDGLISKDIVEIIKNIPRMLDSKDKSDNISLYLNLGDIKGDIYNDSATNSSAGHDNVFHETVSMNGNMSANETGKTDQVLIDLSNYSEVYKYLKQQQQNPYCALLIVLSIFDNSQFDLICDEAKIFYELLVEENQEIINDKGESVVVKREPFEISRQEAASFFGIRSYQDMLITSGGRFLTGFIGFSSEEHSLNILRCVYSEFVSLKDKVTAFLIKLICSEKVVLYISAINTLKKLCDITPEYFVSKVVMRLIQNKSIPSDIAVAQILCSIAECSNSKYRAEKYLGFVPNVNKDIHYYIITLMMCKTLSYNRDKIGKLIRPILKELINQPRLQLMLNQLEIDLPEEENFINNIDLFFNIGNRYSEYYIALLSEICGLLKKMKYNDERREFVYLITLLFIREDYNESCLNTNNPTKFKDMIFIRMILRDNDTSKNLVLLWSELLRSRRFKRDAEKILEKYLTMRNGFINEEIEYMKMEVFFLRLAQDRAVGNTMLFFLKKIASCPKKSIPLAKKLYKNIGGKING